MALPDAFIIRQPGVRVRVTGDELIPVHLICKRICVALMGHPA